MCDLRRHIKNSAISLLALLLLLLAGGCVKNEFKIEFSFPQSSTPTFQLLYYASDSKQGWLVETAVQVRDGKAALLGKTRNPSLVWVMGIDSETFPELLIYAERGDNIKVDATGAPTEPLKWRVSGNKINDALTQWRLDAAKALASGSPREVNKAVADYVKKNPDSPVSTIILSAYFDRHEDASQFHALWKMLKDDATDAKWVELVGSADTIESMGDEQKAPKQVVLSTLATGCDTVRFSGVPVLMAFTGPDRAGNDAVKRELRSLLRDFPDSTKRVVCHISFDPDSSSMVYTSRIDSLSGAVQAWMPLGLSDSQAVAMGVRGVPYLIVSDRKGNFIYSGRDASLAVRKMRDLLNQ